MEEEKLETPLRKPIEFIKKTPPQILKIDQNSLLSIDAHKNALPDLLKVPKALKYPERYRSPTDLMMSPISKGLLARGQKPEMLPPGITLKKV
ncbi:hypothetical protein GIB67_009545 [Kingdonia uniflora]|uniref:Uncharacterized protein n=1 Tax=Kingdonia uniflora TaxID=39325 RepID=A0A7J7NWT5_9MAGN|nr:hypothetical protein GIB67_009545 [Kingdonia uniflora]